jgi:hypothetical protein
LGHIYISYSQLLKNERFIKRILTIDWDLVLVDSFDFRIATGLFRRITAKKILLLINNKSELEKHMELFNVYFITEWNMRNLLVSDGRVEHFVLSFYNSEEENTITDRISLFFKKLLHPVIPDKNIGDKYFHSTYYSAEQLLLKIRNQLVHNDDNNLIINGLEYAVNETNESVLEIEKLIHELSKINKEPAITVLLELINRIQLEETFPCIIFTSYISNVKYLLSLLKEKELNVNAISSDLNPEQIISEIENFNKNGQILIATDIAIKGIEIKAKSIINFDIPGRVEQIFTRQIRVLHPDAILKSYFIIDSKELGKFEKLFPDEFQNIEITPLPN